MCVRFIMRIRVLRGPVGPAIALSWLLTPAASSIAQDYRWAGPQFQDNDPAASWISASNWQRFVSGAWQPAPAPPLLNPIAFDLAGVGTTRAEVDLPATDIVPSLDVTSGEVRVVAGGLTVSGALRVGEVGGVVDPCYLVGRDAGGAGAASIVVQTSTAIDRGELRIRPASSLAAAALSVGQGITGAPAALLDVDSATATAASFSLRSGIGAVTGGGTFSVSGASTHGDIDGQNDPCFFVGRAPGPGVTPGTGTARFQGGLALLSGDVVAAMSGSLLEVGVLGVGGDLVIGESSGIGSVNDPCFFVERSSSASLFGAMRLSRGIVTIRSGASQTVHGTTTMGGLAGINEPCYFVGDAANPGAASSSHRGTFSLRTGEVFVRTTGTTMTIGQAGAEADLLIGDPALPGGVINPCFIVEDHAAATVHGTLRVQRGIASIRGGASMTVNGAARVGEIGSVNDPCYFVGEAGTPGALTVNGFVPIGSGEMVLGGAGSSVTVNRDAGGGGGGIPVRSGGALRGVGQCRVATSVNNAGLVSPGLSPGTLEVLSSAAGGGQYVQTATGTLEIELGGTTSGQFDRLAVSGPVTLAGTLRVVRLASYAPQVGDEMSVVVAASVSGNFAGVVSQGFPPGLGAQAIVEATAVKVRIVAVPVCAGDANGDGSVNGADLSVLLGQFGHAVTPGTGADFNNDGVVNGADLSVLLANFGNVC